MLGLIAARRHIHRLDIAHTGAGGLLKHIANNRLIVRGHLIELVRAFLFRLKRLDEHRAVVTDHEEGIRAERIVPAIQVRHAVDEIAPGRDGLILRDLTTLFLLDHRLQHVETEVHQTL